MNPEKRKIEVVVISDVHLGTYGSHAKELNAYLSSIDPDVIIINGDWVDIWNFNTNYWPSEHTENLFKIFEFVKQGKQVYYLTGNHDDDLRKYSDYKQKHFELIDELTLELNGKKHWIFHGDKFDPSVGNNARWLAKLGGRGYDYMIRANRELNKVLLSMGQERVMISKMLKDNVKKVVKSRVSDFEDVACDHGISHGFDYVICGHIHKPQMRKYSTERGEVMYLNSGDWVENCTSLEYNNGQWKLYFYFPEDRAVRADQTEAVVETAY